MNLCELTVIVLFGVLTVIQYSLPAPILPLEMKRRSISQISIGIAMGSYSLGYILGSVFPTRWLYSTLGRRKTTQLSFLVLGVALLFYGLSYFIPDRFALLFMVGSMMA